jgi:hypothetical protein
MSQAHNMIRKTCPVICFLRYFDLTPSRIFTYSLFILLELRFRHPTIRANVLPVGAYYKHFATQERTGKPLYYTRDSLCGLQVGLQLCKALELVIRFTPVLVLIDISPWIP